MRTLISIVIIAAVLWFAITNSTFVTLHVFLWEANASLALVVGAAFGLGFLLGLLRLAPGFWRRDRAARENKLALEKAQRERDALAERSKVLEEQVHQLAPIENGAKATEK